MSEEIPFADTPVGYDADSSLDNIQVEIVDDRPAEDQRPPHDPARSASFDPDAEIDATADGASAKFAQMRYEYHEQRRRGDSAERERDTAIAYAQGQAAENRKAQALLVRGEEVLLSELAANNKAARTAGQEKYKEAFDRGDGEAMLGATQAISQADIQDAVMKQTRRMVPPTQAPVEMQPQKVAEPLADEWKSKNQWWGQADPLSVKKKALCHALHEIMASEGVHPNDPRYYVRVDQELEQQYGETSQNPQGDEGSWNNRSEDGMGAVDPGSTSRPRQVVAAASRAPSNGPPQKVTLTTTEQQVARRLGVTDIAYAREKLKLQNAGRS